MSLRHLSGTSSLPETIYMVSYSQIHSQLPIPGYFHVVPSNMTKLSPLVLDLCYGTKKHFPNTAWLCAPPASHQDVMVVSQCRCTEHSTLLLQRFCVPAGLHRKDGDLPRENHTWKTWLLTLVYHKEFRQNTNHSTTKSPQKPKSM